MGSEEGRMKRFLIAISLLALSALSAGCAPTMRSTAISSPAVSGGFVWWAEQRAFDDRTEVRVIMCRAHSSPPCLVIQAAPVSAAAMRAWIDAAALADSQARQLREMQEYGREQE